MYHPSSDSAVRLLEKTEILRAKILDGALELGSEEHAESCKQKGHRTRNRQKIETQGTRESVHAFLFSGSLDFYFSTSQKLSD